MWVSLDACYVGDVDSLLSREEWLCSCSQRRMVPDHRHFPLLIRASRPERSRLSAARPSFAALPSTARKAPAGRRLWAAAGAVSRPSGCSVLCDDWESVGAMAHSDVVRGLR
jgi:hypothetical protein